MVARFPTFLYLNGSRLSLPDIRALILLATYAPSSFAADASPGTGVPSGLIALAVSPITNTFSWLGIVSLGPTIARPARSAGEPSQRAAGEAATPAAQTIVRAGIRNPFTTTPAVSHWVTGLPSMTSTPSF